METSYQKLPRLDEPFPFLRRMATGDLQHADILLLAPPGCGKSTYAKQFIYEGLMEGETCILLATDDFPDDIRSSIEKISGDVKPHIEEKLCIIDCYSPIIGVKSSSPYSASPRDLQQMLVTIQKLTQGLDRFRFVLDSITTLAMHNGPGVGMQFLHILLGRLRYMKAPAIFLLESGVHDESFMSFLRFMFDGVMEMKIEEDKEGLRRYMRIYSLTGAKALGVWIPFGITDRGISLGSASEIEKRELLEYLNEAKKKFVN